MIKKRYRRTVTCLTSALVFVLIVSTAHAAGDAKWEYRGAVYLWGAGIGATTNHGDDIELSFSDLLSNLDFAFMAAFEAQRGRWGGLADLVYMSVSAEDTTTGNIVGNPVTMGVDVGMKSWIITGAVTYAFYEDERNRLEALGGARYLDLDTRLDFRLGAFLRSVAQSDDVIDGVVGLRGRTSLNDRWYLSYLADVGAGGSDLTWQALAGFNYRFNRIDAGFGYRYMAWEFDDYLLGDMDVSGPYAGIRYLF